MAKYFKLRTLNLDLEKRTLTVNGKTVSTIGMESFSLLKRSDGAWSLFWVKGSTINFFEEAPASSSQHDEKAKKIKATVKKIIGAILLLLLMVAFVSFLVFAYGIVATLFAVGLTIVLIGWLYAAFHLLDS